MKTAQEVGKRLQALRGTQRLEAVAVAVGVSPQALEAYEAGQRLPRDDVKIRLADYYRQDIAELFF